MAAIARSEAGVVTKADLAGFATRGDLARSAPGRLVRGRGRAAEATSRPRSPSRDRRAEIRRLQTAGVPAAAAGEIVAAIARSEAGVVTKADLAGFATREDLARTEIRWLLTAFAVAGLLFAALRFSG